MIAKLLAFIFTALVGLSILWAGLAFIFGLFIVSFARIVRHSSNPKGWLWVICLFPFLLLTEKGRNKIKKTI